MGSVVVDYAAILVTEAWMNFLYHLVSLSMPSMFFPLSVSMAGVRYLSVNNTLYRQRLEKVGSQTSESCIGRTPYDSPMLRVFLGLTFDVIRCRYA